MTPKERKSHGSPWHIDQLGIRTGIYHRHIGVDGHLTDLNFAKTKTPAMTQPGFSFSSIPTAIRAAVRVPTAHPVQHQVNRDQIYVKPSAWNQPAGFPKMAYHRPHPVAHHE